MSDIEGKAVQDNSERVWETNEFQSRKLEKIARRARQRWLILFSLGEEFYDHKTNSERTEAAGQR
jgi:hypothetical protein